MKKERGKEKMWKKIIENKYVTQMGIKRGFDGWWGG